MNTLKSDVTALHEKTKESMMNCKRALLRTGGDLQKAEELILIFDLSPSGSAKISPSDYPIGSVVPFNQYFRFTNVSTSKVLALNDSKTAMVLEAKAVGDFSQRQIIYSGSDRRIYPEFLRPRPRYDGCTTLCLDVGPNNSVVFSPPLGLQVWLYVTAHSTTFNAPIFKFVSRSDGLHLMANENGAGVVWSPTYNSRCDWYAERIIRMDGVYGDFLLKGVEFFSAATMNHMPPFSGALPYTLNDGTIPMEWHYAADNLYTMCFGEEAFYNAQEWQIYGNMYGALYNQSKYDGKFHTGFDIHLGWKMPFMSPVAGTVVQSGGGLGEIVIRGHDGLYYIFLHSDDEWRIDNDVEVAVGDPLGLQGNKGISSIPDDADHVHFEISSTATPSAIPASSFTNLGTTYFPYDICCSWINV